MPSWEETLEAQYGFDEGVTEVLSHQFENCLVYSGVKNSKTYFIVISFEAGYIYDDATLDLYDSDFNKIETIGYEFC